MSKIEVDLQEAHHHPGSTGHEDNTSAEAVNDPETNDCAENVDGSENDLGDVAVTDSSGSKDCGAKVEEEVGSGQLLACLENNSESCTVEHARGSENFSPAERFSVCILLINLFLDVCDLLVDDIGVGRKANETGNGLASLISATTAVGKSRALREEQNTSTESQSPCKGEAVGDSPRSAVTPGLCSPVDHFGGPDTQGNEQLVRRDNDTTDQGGSTL